MFKVVVYCVFGHSKEVRLKGAYLREDHSLIPDLNKDILSEIASLILVFEKRP